MTVLLQALANDDCSSSTFVPVMDCDQHMRQTEGWDSSRNHLETILSSCEPFDGIMGFSQVQ